MYYKIENKECAVYKKLHKMRTEEIRMGIENRNAVEEKVGLKFTTFLGRGGQQNVTRVTGYQGFRFLQPAKVDPEIWKLNNEHDGIYIPNKRTKLGREMQDFLSNKLQKSWYMKPLEILGLPDLNKFSFPFVEIAGELIIIYLDAQFEPKDKNVIEITKTEFDQYIKELNSKSK